MRKEYEAISTASAPWRDTKAKRQSEKTKYKRQMGEKVGRTKKRREIEREIERERKKSKTLCEWGFSAGPFSHCHYLPWYTRAVLSVLLGKILSNQVEMNLCFHFSKTTSLILKIWVSLSKGNRANESFSRLNNLDKKLYESLKLRHCTVRAMKKIHSFEKQYSASTLF